MALPYLSVNVVEHMLENNRHVQRCEILGRGLPPAHAHLVS